MNKKQKKMLIRIVIAAVLVVCVFSDSDERICKIRIVHDPISGHWIRYPEKAGKGILNRQMFDENFLMAVATIGAILLGDYKEGVAVMLFYQIGELFQSYAVGKSRRNISELMDIRPDYANVERDGKLEQVDPDEVEIGSVIVVQPGEKVPIDGIVAEGTSTLNTSALTGESVPQDVHCGDEIISGCINMTGVLKIKTTKEFGESTVSRILDLVENASSQKSKSREFYFKVCQILYSGGMLRCGGSGCIASAGSYTFHGTVTGMGRLDLPCTDFPGYQLSMCTGHQYSVKFLCGHRRCK